VSDRHGTWQAFKGPLDASYVGDGRGPDAPIRLGGDLHAVHPGAAPPGRRPRRDHSLDAATITLHDDDHESVVAVARQGVWSLVLRGDMLDSAPYFTLWDSEGRLRTWLLLPPARELIDAGHLWLPSVPPRQDPADPRPRA
jgi:hypothetical protein